MIHVHVLCIVDRVIQFIFMHSVHVHMYISKHSFLHVHVYNFVNKLCIKLTITGITTISLKTSENRS